MEPRRNRSENKRIIFTYKKSPYYTPLKNKLLLDHSVIDSDFQRKCAICLNNVDYETNLWCQYCQIIWWGAWFTNSLKINNKCPQWRKNLKNNRPKKNIAWADSMDIILQKEKIRRKKEEELEAKYSYCEEHQNKATLFWENCQMLLCNICYKTSFGHLGHHTVTPEIHLEMEKEELASKTVGIEGQVEELDAIPQDYITNNNITRIANATSIAEVLFIRNQAKVSSYELAKYRHRNLSFDELEDLDKLVKKFKANYIKLKEDYQHVLFENDFEHIIHSESFQVKDIPTSCIWNTQSLSKISTDIEIKIKYLETEDSDKKELIIYANLINKSQDFIIIKVQTIRVRDIKGKFHRIDGVNNINKMTHNEDKIISTFIVSDKLLVILEGLLKSYHKVKPKKQHNVKEYVMQKDHFQKPGQSFYASNGDRITWYIEFDLTVLKLNRKGEELWKKQHASTNIKEDTLFDIFCNELNEETPKASIRKTKNLFFNGMILNK